MLNCTVGWKTTIKRLVNRLGYDVVALNKSRNIALEDYMPCIPYDYRTWSPWFSTDFQHLYDRVRSHTVVKEDRCYTLREVARHCLSLPGNYAECGVYKGGTAYLIADLIKDSGKALDLFDTFGGMPEGTEEDPSGHATGDFGDVTLESVMNYLSAFRFLRFFAGRIPDTFKSLSGESYCFVHVDVDLYASVRDCCQFFYDRLSQGGVMVFDDYGFEMYKDAAKKAVDEFFASRPEVPLPLRTGQSIIIKL